MDFAFTKDQELIRKSAKEFFEKECPKEKVRELKDDPKGYDPKMWKKLAQLGYAGMVIPEEYGGMEGDFVELMILMEEIGRNIVPGPFFATVVLCGIPLTRFGTSEQKKAYLQGIAEKGKIWTMALAEGAGTQEAADVHLSAEEKDDGFVLNGTKLFVPYANSADYLLVAARTGRGDDPQDGITVFVVDAGADGITCEVIPTTARDMRCELMFKDVSVAAGSVLGEVGKGWEVIDHTLQQAGVLKAAEMSGGAQAVHDIAVKYARDRMQFGKPIGSFQAIQFKLVDLLTDVEGLKYLVHEASWKIDTGEPSRMLNSMAKAKANGVYHRVCYNGIYIHGAIGWTEEMDIGLYHLRTKAMEFDGGSTDMHHEVIAQELEVLEPDFQKVYG